MASLSPHNWNPSAFFKSSLKARWTLFMSAGRCREGHTLTSRLHVLGAAEAHAALGVTLTPALAAPRRPRTLQPYEVCPPSRCRLGPSRAPGWLLGGPSRRASVVPRQHLCFVSIVVDVPVEGRVRS